MSLGIFFVKYLWAGWTVFSCEHQQSDLCVQRCSGAIETATSSVCVRSSLNAAALTIQESCTDVFVRDFSCRRRWPHGLRRRSAVPRLLGLRVRIPPGTWMSVVSVVCCQRSLQRADPSFRGFLLKVFVCVCHWVWSDAIIILYNYNEQAEVTLEKKERKTEGKKERRY